MQLTISHCDAKGRGVGATEKGDIAVPFTVPGDVVRAAPRGKRHGVRIGAIEEINTPSPDRVTPRCPYAGRCGGCPWQMFDYAAQLRYKREIVVAALNPFLPLHLGGGVRGGGTVQRGDEYNGAPPTSHPLLISPSFRARGSLSRGQAEGEKPDDIPPILPSPEQYYYRNRMDYAFGADGSLGLREPGSWSRVLDLSTCFLLSEDGVRCMEQVRAWAREHHIPGWDARAHTGFLRYLVLREGKRTGDRLAMLITAPGELPAREDLVRRLKSLTTGVLWGVNDGVADVSRAEHYETLCGTSVLHEELCDVGSSPSRCEGELEGVGDGGIYTPHPTYPPLPTGGEGSNTDTAPPLRFQIPPNAFFQTNTLAAELLIATVRDFAALSPTATLVDLYCGVGMFAIALARDTGRVIGVELERSAIEAARHNAEMNGITNTTFQVIAAESWPFPIEPIDCLIVDPPRAGLHPKTLGKILANAPQRIVYVSCNPAALARDLRILLSPSSRGGVGGGAYRIERIQPIDLFPHSYHVETVVLLTRHSTSRM